jgi:hypothetical protein
VHDVGDFCTRRTSLACPWVSGFPALLHSILVQRIGSIAVKRGAPGCSGEAMFREGGALFDAGKSELAGRATQAGQADKAAQMQTKLTAPWRSACRA